MSERTRFELRDLTVAYRERGRPVVVVQDVSLTLKSGRILGLAGESGCGKSTTAVTTTGYRVANADVNGRATLRGLDVLSLRVPELRQVWGQRIAHVEQNASLSLDPARKVGKQLDEVLATHTKLAPPARRTRALAALHDVRLPDPEEALSRFPHQFSGGQQQRLALALALVCEPDVLVLDEPTTGLDATTQTQVARLIRRLVDGARTATLFVSHDLALLASVADELAIMYAGEIVERGPAHEVYRTPRHPYTAALLAAVPRIEDAAPMVGIPGRPPLAVVPDRCPYSDRCAFARPRCRDGHPPLEQLAPTRDVRCVRTHELGPIEPERAAAPRWGRRAASSRGVLLDVRGLVCTYRPAGTVAVDCVSLDVAEEEVLGVVGESGSGKSTLLRAIAGLRPPSHGEILFDGRPLPPRAIRRTRSLRQAIQIVFQNPDSSLNPRHTVLRILERPLTVFRPELSRRARRRVAAELLEDVRLDVSTLHRYPHQLSGGQKQRVAIARAFAARPRLLLCDEVTSALDVSVQASILELLAELGRDLGTTFVLVTHDLALVRSVADRVCVMRDGRVCEIGATETVFESPTHAYTRELIAAVPHP